MRRMRDLPSEGTPSRLFLLLQHIPTSLHQFQAEKCPSLRTMFQVHEASGSISGPLLAVQYCTASFFFLKDLETRRDWYM